MAKFECVFPSGYSFNDILQYFHTHLTKNHGECTGSSDYSSERARVAVRVYERYSLMGDNYLSLTLTLVNDGGDTFASAISAAGRGGGLGISILSERAARNFVDEKRVLCRAGDRSGMSCGEARPVGGRDRRGR